MDLIRVHQLVKKPVSVATHERAIRQPGKKSTITIYIHNLCFELHVYEIYSSLKSKNCSHAPKEACLLLPNKKAPKMHHFPYHNLFQIIIILYKEENKTQWGKYDQWRNNNSSPGWVSAWFELYGLKSQPGLKLFLWLKLNLVWKF